MLLLSEIALDILLILFLLYPIISESISYRSVIHHFIFLVNLENVLGKHVLNRGKISVWGNSYLAHAYNKFLSN